MRWPTRCLRLHLLVQAALVLATCVPVCLRGQEPEQTTKPSKLEWKTEWKTITPEESLEMWKKFAEMQRQRQEHGEPLLSFVDFIEIFHNEDQKRESLTKQAMVGAPWLKIAGRWSLIDAPEVGLPWAMVEDEPISPEVLDVLSRLFPFSKDETTKLGIATLLYRYRVPAGREYLLQVFREEPTADVALILALNRESEALEGIATLFRSEKPSEELIYALGRWGPETTFLLKEDLLFGRGSRGTYVRALVMAEHEPSDELIGRLQGIFESRDLSTKITVAAALLRLRPGAEELKQFLLGRVYRWEDDKLLLFRLSESVRATGIAGAEEYLRAIIVKRLEGGSGVYFDEDCFSAVRALANYGREEDLELLRRVLERHLDSRDPNQQQISAIAEQIYAAGSEDGRALLLEVMGPEYVANLVVLRSLRRLPAKWLPVRSRAAVPRNYWID